MANVVTDEVGKARVISHMNKDHPTDLSHILQHFNGLSAADAADATMLEISLDSITVASKSGTHVVKLDPPMHWDERRQRLIDITLAARAALGVPSTDGAESHGSAANANANANARLNEFVPPQGFDIVVAGAVAMFLVLYGLVSNGQIEPGSAAWRTLERIKWPYGPQGFKTLVKLVFAPTLAIHVAECWWLDRSRLQKHGIQRGTKVWCLWLGSCFFDGVSSFMRFDRTAKQLAKKSH